MHVTQVATLPALVASMEVRFSMHETGSLHAASGLLPAPALAQVLATVPSDAGA